MKTCLSIVCLAVLVGMATPCCLPDQGSFDFTMRMNSSLTPGSHSMSGSGSFDFTKQKFYVSAPAILGQVYIDLSKQDGGTATVSSVYQTSEGPRKVCNEIPFSGKVGTPWQCILDNDNIFIDLEGSDNYLLYLPPVAYGPITMKQGTCIPISADVEYDVEVSPTLKLTTTVHLAITNFVERVVDEDVFKAPCKATSTANTVSIPTPDQLVQMIPGVGMDVGRPDAESSEELASPESDESKSEEKKK